MNNANIKWKLNKTKKVLGSGIKGGLYTSIGMGGPTLMIYGGYGHVNLYPLLFVIGVSSLVGTGFGVSYALSELKEDENIDNQELGKEKIKK